MLLFRILELPVLYDFIACLSKTHFIKILHNPSHPLFKRLVLTIQEHHHVGITLLEQQRQGLYQTPKAFSSLK